VRGLTRNGHLPTPIRAAGFPGQTASRTRVGKLRRKSPPARYSPRRAARKALALRPGQRFYCQYDFGDNWQFHGRLHQIPARVGPALWAHARLTDTPAAQYAAWGKAPEQYPHAEPW
jgi:hypothetical protein